MGLEGEIIELGRMGDIVVLHGRQVLLALAILVAGLLISKIIVKYIKRILERFLANKATAATIANTFFVLLAVIVFVVALEQAGARSIVVDRVLAGAALVITAIIFLVRPLIPTLPFKVGNMVQLGGLVGKVEGITLVHTRLKSFDGKTYFIPNQKILSETVVNYHFTPERQIRLSVVIRYSDDILKAEKILAELMAADPKIHEKPTPKVYLANLGDSGVELSVRCWVENPKYWAVRCALLKKIKLRFDQEGIVIPFPQRDVHLDGLASEQAVASPSANSDPEASVKAGGCRERDSEHS